MKIMVLIMMMAIPAKATERGASCTSFDYPYNIKCIWNRSLPSDPNLRKLYLENASLKDLCYEYFRLKNNIAEQSHHDSDAMYRYNNNVLAYIEGYVNPRLKDIQDIKTRYPSVGRDSGRCWAL